jgi:hypothetical protein
VKIIVNTVKHYPKLSAALIALPKETEERKETIWRKVAEEAARNYETVNGLKNG